MRVIAGEAKGRRLVGSRTGSFRPTTDRVREALFSMIGPAVSGARVLDLYAGSGALGIEALSRGAASAVLVDSDRAAAQAIQANLARTGLEARATVLNQSAERFLSRPAGVFDLIFLDPPYPVGLPVDALDGLVAGGFLAEGGEVVVETSAGLAVEPEPCAGLAVAAHRRYGDSALVFLQHRQPAPAR